MTWSSRPSSYLHVQGFPHLAIHSSLVRVTCSLRVTRDRNLGTLGLETGLGTSGFHLQGSAAGRFIKLISRNGCQVFTFLMAMMKTAMILMMVLTAITMMPLKLKLMVMNMMKMTQMMMMKKKKKKQNKNKEKKKMMKMMMMMMMMMILPATLGF